MGDKWPVLISGCSGGGKSTVLAELKRRGFEVVAEPGRRIVAEELRAEGNALPWVDLAAFAERALTMAQADFAAARGTVFFDRGMVDAAVALEHATGRPALARIAMQPYHRRVFLAPPWPEIYANDADRRHGLGDAIDEYERPLRAYSAFDYTIELLPKVDLGQRADFILDRLGLGPFRP